MPHSNYYDQLIAKLDQFTRKFYVNQVIRGLLYTTGLVLALFLLVSLLESQFYFSTGTRKLMFYGFLGLSLAALSGWVLLPLARYFRLGDVISHDKAAEMVGAHFTNVKDKLLNVLQLRRQATTAGDSSLLLASIDQKASEISPVPFRSAIDLSKNRAYLKYALPPFILLIAILVAAPTLITDGTNRLLRNNEAFERPAPFRFVVEQGDDLEVIQYGDFPLTVRVEGDELPANAYIEVDGYRYGLSKETANTFRYDFNNVQADTKFKLSTAAVESEEFTLAVLAKPNIAAFTVDVNYPRYLGRNSETLANIGDLTVPAGTRLKWSFDTENTDNIGLRFSGEETIADLRRDGTNLFSFDKTARKNDRYTLYVGNDRLPLADSVSYALSVIPDLYPQITVESFADSTDEQLLYFVGEANDDYGLSKLNFVYLVKDGETGQESTPVTVPIGVSGKQTRYDYVWDLRSELELTPGDELTYYFEVFDNDGVNGAKSARTGLMSFRSPSEEELEEQADQNDAKVKDQLKKALEATKKLQEDTKDLREKMLQEKEMDWKMKKELEKINERQKEVQKQIQEAQQAFQENLEKQQQQDESILEKQEKLQEMFEKTLDEKMQDLMEQIQELMEKLEKEEVLEKMEEMELNDEQMEAELERMEELFKQLEVEDEMRDQMEKLEELAKQQEELAEETAKEEKPQEELQKEQEEIKEEFEKLQEEMKETQEKNEDLERPMEMPEDQEEQAKEAEEAMDEASEKMEEQKNSEASEKQKKAGKKMKEMAQSMAGAMQGQQKEGMEEDMAAIRQLLENIVDLSFDQEETMDELNINTVNTPRYVELVQAQFQINNDFELVRDSLNALAKRNAQIETFVTEKVTEIKGNLKQTVAELEERRTPQAANVQQRAMTGLNDLALMLSESMSNMQQQMAGMMAGDQQCESPGKGKGNKPGKPSSNPGSDGQRSLNDAVENMKKGKKDGEKGSEGGSAKEFAEMAARQAALRKALEAKQKARQEGGKGIDPELQELIDKMNEAEEDMVNKRLTNEMIQRQQEILNKMLDHERAERQQEMDEQRKSEVAQQRRKELPAGIEEYIKKRKAEIEMFKRVTPELNPYFQGLVDEYFRSLRGN